MKSGGSKCHCRSGSWCSPRRRLGSSTLSICCFCWMCSCVSQSKLWTVSCETVDWQTCSETMLRNSRLRSLHSPRRRDQASRNWYGGRQLRASWHCTVCVVVCGCVVWVWVFELSLFLVEWRSLSLRKFGHWSVSHTHSSVRDRETFPSAFFKIKLRLEIMFSLLKSFKTGERIWEQSFWKKQTVWIGTKYFLIFVGGNIFKNRGIYWKNCGWAQKPVPVAGKYFLHKYSIRTNKSPCLNWN